MKEGGRSQIDPPSRPPPPPPKKLPSKSPALLGLTLRNLEWLCVLVFYSRMFYSNFILIILFDFINSEYRFYFVHDIIIENKYHL